MLQKRWKIEKMWNDNCWNRSADVFAIERRKYEKERGGHERNTKKLKAKMCE